MKKINRYSFLATFLVLAYLMSACSGAPVSDGNQQSQNAQGQEVVFTGTVEAVNGNQWTVNGQTITIDEAALVNANIAVGDNVKVEARVGQDGSVTAVSIEITGAEAANANSNNDNQNDSNANDNTSNSNDNQDDNSNSDNGNANDNSSDGEEQEVSGLVEAVTAESITINGVTYMFADFTEFKDLIVSGDQVKLHVIVNADGTFTIREIEKTVATGVDDGNSNNNGSDDNSNSNDDNGNDDGGNDDNGNDSGGDDNNGNDSGGGDDDGNGNG